MNECMPTLEPATALELQAVEPSHDLKCSDAHDKNDESGQQEMALSSVQGSEMESLGENAIQCDRKEGHDTDKNDDRSNAHGCGEGNIIKNTSEGQTANLESPDPDPADPDLNREHESENPEPEPVPTDECGRELSAYEIMRLEQTLQNQAKLAQLGLENASRKMPVEDRKKKAKNAPSRITLKLANTLKDGGLYQGNQR